MPSSSDRQRRFMQAAAHNKEFADKVGIDQSVAKEFINKDLIATFESKFVEVKIDPFVFLGGCIEKNTYRKDWRYDFIRKLRGRYFNPIVEEWNEEARLKEETLKSIADINLFVITSDRNGFYTLYEIGKCVVQSFYSTVFLYIDKSKDDKPIRYDGDPRQHSESVIKGIINDLNLHKAKAFTDVDECAKYINYVLGVRKDYK